MNKWWSRNLKWMVVVSALLVLVATAPVVSAGRRWSGIDPVLQVNGDQFNITVFWPEEFDCYIDGIDFTVTVPRGADAEVLDESTGEFACGDGSYNKIETVTRSRLFGEVSPTLDISDGAWGRERPMRPSVSLGRE